jgi:hypothetical protein
MKLGSSRREGRSSGKRRAWMESESMEERLKESRRRRKAREQESTAIERAVDVLVSEKESRSRAHSHSRYNFHYSSPRVNQSLSQSGYTLRNARENSNTKSLGHFNLDYRPNINIDPAQSRDQGAKQGVRYLKTYESSGNNTYQAQGSQNGIVRNVAPAERVELREKREASPPRGISLTREKSPEQGRTVA